MNRKRTAAIGPLFLVTVIALAYTIQYSCAEDPAIIYIRANGSIDPPTAPLNTSDNTVYTFTADVINKSLVVERDNILIDGMGFTIQGTGGSRGIDLLGRSNVTITNIKVKAFFDGIFLNGSSSNRILGNTITNCGRIGINLFYYSHANVISGNNVTDNFFGIYSTNSSGTIIDGNNIVDNTDGIIIYFSSGNISNNNIANNNNGVLLDQSSSVFITGNNVTNNGNGMYLFYASGNNIYHNNFVNNTLHVYINAAGYANVWDNGYPEGGNYWSNHTDTDLYKGPYQNETGNDEIWDHPYIINEDNRDNYPIVPEFHALLLLPLFLASTVLAAIIQRKRRENERAPRQISTN